MPLVEQKIALSPVLFQKRVEFQEPPLEGKKALRAEDTLKLTVEVDGLLFDADEKSMDRMGRIVNIANWRCLQAMAAGATAPQAYQTVYVDTLVPWKTADNVMRQVPARAICAAQEKALFALSEVWVRYG